MQPRLSKFRSAATAFDARQVWETFTTKTVCRSLTLTLDALAFACFSLLQNIRQKSISTLPSFAGASRVF
jgi:hypothetical protein